jgi:uncharacterized protein
MMSGSATATSLLVIDHARSGRFEEIRDMFAPPLRTMVSADALRAAWKAELDRRGPVSSVGAPVSEPAQTGATVVKVPVACERAGFTLLASIAESGELVGLQLAPPSAAAPATPWAPPEYARPASFQEQDITLGSGELAVPGTLSMPLGQGRRPAVVLLAGSGPNDRDESIGQSKPLKDLAWGLATRGVAVLRFDKVTYAQPRAVVAIQDFTVVDEYLPHARAAISMLREHPEIDHGRVFVLGHSLGGTIAPQVAAAEPSVAGLVIMAGGTQPLHWSIVRQFSHLAALRPETAAAAQQTIDTVTEQARLVDSPDLSTATPADRLPFGVPAPYWLHLRGYRPAEIAASVPQPMLILQGGRDYQVTVTDDLALWEAALSDRTDVTIKIYPRDDHFFFPGDEAPGPMDGGPTAEYGPPQHVDAEAVADIAAWLTDVGPRSA